MSKAAVGFLVFLVLAVYLFPITYLVSTSFKQAGATLAIPPTLLPQVWSLENYQQALSRYPNIPHAFASSLAVATISMLVSLGLAIPAAYGISWFGTGAGRIFLIVTLITRMIPGVSMGIPLFLVLSRARLIDTWLGLALAHVTVSLPLSIWLLAGFYEAVPREIEAAARVDGCSRLGALARVVLPVIAGGVGVTAIFAFLASWNDLLFALLITSTNAQTVPVAIASLNGQYGVEWGPMTALSAAYSLPVIGLSIFIQRQIVAGMTGGAVKG